MVQHLQDILGKLYRPPADGTRQVFALSRSDAERLPLLPSIAVISITAPERLPANIGDFVHVLRLCFADVDFLNPHLSQKARGKRVHAFTVENGNDIRAFIEALPDEVASVVAHCGRVLTVVRCRRRAASALRLPRGASAPFEGQRVNCSCDDGRRPWIP